MYGPAWRPARRAYGVTAVALVLLAVLLHETQWGGLGAVRAYLDVATTVVALGAAVLCLLRSQELPSERRIAWTFLGAACLAWGLGGVAWTYQDLWVQRDVPPTERLAPFPSMADAGRILMLPFAAGALLVMVIGSTQAATRLRTFLDGLLIASALLFASWVLFLERIVDYAGSQQDALARTLALTYPLGDVFLFGLLLLVASRSPPQVRRTMAFIGAALVAILVADIGFWYYVAGGRLLTGAWTDPGWIAGFLLIGYAALRPIPVVPPGEAPRPGLLLGALPLAPFVVSTGLAMVVQVQRGALPPFLFWNAIVVVGVLAVRQFVMVYENLQLRRETEDALDHLQEAERLRSNLLHTITHDIQNPLSPILIQLRILRERSALADPDRKRLDVVQRNVDQVVRLSSDLADVSKLQDGRLRLLLQPMDLRHVLEDVATSFGPLARDRGIELHFGDGPPLPVAGDALRLRQVVANLVSNASKFTPKGGSVTVAGALREGRAVVEVTDTGRGLDPDELARLFRPFSQIDPAASAHERGTGLGLFISKGLIESHGGSVEATSPGRGHGSTFRFWLPALPPAPPDDASPAPSPPTANGQAGTTAPPS